MTNAILRTLFLFAFFLALVPSGIAAQDDDYLDVDEAFTYTAVEDDGKLTVTFVIAPDYYLYRDRTSVRDAQGNDLPVDFSQAIEKYDPNFEEVMAVYYETAVLEADLVGQGDAVSLKYQGCANEGLCFAPQTREISLSQAMSGTGGTLAQPLPERDSLSAILLALVMAFTGGIVLNLMPCVFPVLTMKAMSLTQTAGEGQAALRRQGIAYAAGVVASFLLVATILLVLRSTGEAVGWGFQMQSPVVVTALLVLFFAMGLSLSGVVELGAGLTGMGQGLTSKPGIAGSFMTGVLTTVVASPCTAPFMGAALGFAVMQPGFIALSIFGALGLGLAFPMLLLSLLPATARWLPKPGAWMDTVKKIAAFPLYLTCVWLLWVLTNQAGSDIMAAVLVGLVLLAAAAWQFGRKQLSGGRQFVPGALAFAAVSFAFLPLFIAPSGAAAKADAAQEDAFTQERLDTLLAQGRPVFVNLTADWCITCMVNRKVALDRDAVQQAFAKNDVEYLVGDWTNEDAEISKFLNAHNRSGVPLYLYYPAGEKTPIILPQILTEQIVLDTLSKS